MKKNTMPDFDEPHLAPIFDTKPDLPEKLADNFAEAVEDITPFSQDKVNLYLKKKLSKRSDKAYHRDQATQDISQVADGLSTETVAMVDSDQALHFSAPGIQLKTLQRLRKGHLPWEQGIDLHGLNIEDARNHLSQFIRSSYQQQKQIVLVVHGKAYSQSGSSPMLKSYTNDWLRQLPEVLAFSSAQPKDGGTGALYVLLRRRK